MRTVVTGGQVFDGTGSPSFPGEVVLEGDRVVEVRAGHSPELLDDVTIIDVAGHTVMPGLVESHAHLTFPSAVGHIDPSFNPPLDVSFFHHIEGFPSELARAERNARILLDAGFTSAYSAGVPSRDAHRAGRARQDSRRRDPRPADARRGC
jgi:cytosine/adenosine deaminase-related metal-dependent hydrolase